MMYRGTVQPHTLLISLFMLLALCATTTAQPREETAWRDFGDALATSASAIVPPGVRLSVWVDDGKVYHWNADLPAALDLRALAAEAGTHDPDPRDVLDAWCAHINAKLIARTKDAVLASGKDPAFNPEVDVAFYASGDALPHVRGLPPKGPRRDTYYHISFTGSRRNAIYDEQEQLIRPADPPTGGEITVLIEPDRRDWAWRELITGNLVITNTGSARIRLSSWSASDVAVTDEKGTVPERFPMQGTVTPGGPRNIFLNPGESRRTTFLVCTDPLTALANGYLLDAGKWTLAYPEDRLDNIRVLGCPEVIEVHRRADEYTGPRIRWLQAVGRNLAIFREDSVVELVDLEREVRLARRTPTKDTDVWGRLGPSADFGPDGAFAMYRSRSGDAITLERLFGPSPPRTSLHPPAAVRIGQGGFHVARISADGTRAFCSTNYTWAELELSSNQCIRTVELPEMWSKISPDGNYAASVPGMWGGSPANSYGQYLVRIFPMDQPSTSRDVIVTGKARGSWLEMGAKNAYVADDSLACINVIPYADAPTCTIQTAAPASFVGESPDGSLIALSWPPRDNREPTPTTVGVFRVADGTPISILHADGPITVLMLTDPPRLVCFDRRNIDVAEHLLEKARIYDLETCTLLKEVDLTPQGLPKHRRQPYRTP